MTRRSWTASAVLVAALAVAALGALTRAPAPRVLWWQGRAVSWAGDRGVVLSGAGALVLFENGRAEPLILRAGSRTLLEADIAPDRTIWLVDGSGAVLRREPDGGVSERGRTPFDVPTLGVAPDGRLWAARSARQFTFRPEPDTAPAALLLDRTLSVVRHVGSVAVPSNPFLSQLVNAGHVLPVADGGIVFAPFIRDDVTRYDPSGRVRWALRRGLAHATPDPQLSVKRTADGRPDVQVDYAPVNLGLALGPDGRLYVLSTPAATTATSRLDAVDLERGVVTGTWRFPTALPTLAVDRAGKVTVADPDRLLRGAPAGSREPLPPFDLRGLDSGRVRLADHAGHPVLVNFWASWCGPCREEMPALDSLQRSYGGRMALVALSDDVSPELARRFIHERGFTFPVGLGGGELKTRYHYVGLPHTVLLDAAGRVVRQWSGFAGASQLQAIGALVDAELARAAAGGSRAEPHHHGMM